MIWGEGPSGTDHVALSRTCVFRRRSEAHVPHIRPLQYSDDAVECNRMFYIFLRKFSDAFVWQLRFEKTRLNVWRLCLLLQPRSDPSWQELQLKQEIDEFLCPGSEKLLPPVFVQLDSMVAFVNINLHQTVVTSHSSSDVHTDPRDAAQQILFFW